MQNNFISEHGSIQIKKIAWHPYCIPLPSDFSTNHETLATRKGVIIEISTIDGIIGIGESAPLSAFSGGTLQDILADLTQLSTQLPGQTIHQALKYLHQHAFPPSTATICGLEIALLDILGQQTSLSLSALLSNSQDNTVPPPRTAIPVNAVIGNLPEDLAAQRAYQAVQNGYSCIKIKMGHEKEKKEIERVRTIRNAIGEHTQLRLDANEAWNLEQAITILTGCEDLNIEYIEQPLSRRDISGMRILRHYTPIPLAVDEALSNLASAHHILEAQAADIFILKPQLAGGLITSQQIIQLAASYNIRSVITSTIETGIGIVAALHLAASLPEITLACGLATLPMLADDLLTENIPIQNGYLPVPTGPGLGIQLDRQALTTYRQ